jgi:hypothetical protein
MELRERIQSFSGDFVLHTAVAKPTLALLVSHLLHATMLVLDILGRVTRTNAFAFCNLRSHFGVSLFPRSNVRDLSNLLANYRRGKVFFAQSSRALMSVLEN